MQRIFQISNISVRDLGQNIIMERHSCLDEKLSTKELKNVKQNYRIGAAPFLTNLFWSVQSLPIRFKEKGSTFIFLVGRSDILQTLMKENNSPPVEEHQKRNSQILLVSLHPDLAISFQKTLENYSCDILAVSKYEEVLPLITTEKPDLVLLAYDSPEGNLSELCKTIKSKRQENFLPLIIVLANDKTSTHLEEILTLADDVLKFPFEASEIKSKVRFHLRFKEVQYQLFQYLKLEKELLEEMAKKNETLSEVNSLKDMFLATASHDLLTPLNVVQGSCEQILYNQAGVFLSPKQLKALYQIQSSTSYMISIVHELLNSEVKATLSPIHFKF